MGASGPADEQPGLRHPTLYYEDGDVVLSSDSVDQITTFYRVDKIILSRQSIVFQEMFALPMIPTPGEMYDGVAWVRMPDSTEELALFLEGLYSAGALPLKRRHPDTALRLTGVMKLAKKYEVDSLRTLILRHLEADWPQNVEEWGDFQVQMSHAKEQHLNNPPYYKYSNLFIDERFPEAGSSLRFALDHKCPSLLRAISMVLVTTARSAEWDNVRRSKHDMQFEPFASQRVVHFPSVRWQQLETVDWSSLAKGKEQLFGILQQMAHGKAPVIYGTSTCRQCSSNLQTWRGTITGRLSPVDYQWPDPIYQLKRLLESGRPDAVCGPCWDRAEKAVKEMRQTLWEDLPSMFEWHLQMSN